MMETLKKILAFVVFAILVACIYAGGTLALIAKFALAAVIFCGIIYVCWISFRSRKEAKEKQREDDKKSKQRAAHYFSSLHRALGAPYQPFQLSDHDKQYLEERNYNPEAIYHLVVLYMLHLKASFTMFNVKVKDGSASETAGQYFQSMGLPTIEVLVKPYYTGDQVIAIVCHECMHHFLQEKKVRGKTEMANEKLTDYACVYTGFGELLKKGYIKTTATYNGQQIENKVGYISANDIKIAQQCLDDYRNLS